MHPEGFSSCSARSGSSAAAMEDVIRLVSSGDDVKIWNSASMTMVEQFNPHSATHPVARVCWSSNNQFLVSASTVGDKLVVSSLKSSPVPVVELAEGKKQTRVSLNSTSQFLVSGGLDGTVYIWDLKTKKQHRTLQDHKEEVTCVSFNVNDSYIASGSTSGDIIMHSITTNLSSKPFGLGPNQPIHDLKYSYVKRSLLGSVSDSGTVVLWDANTQKELHVFEGSHKAPCSGLAFSPANDLLFVTVGLDKKIICYDTSSKIVLRSMRVDSPLTAIDFTPDGAGLAVGSTQGKVYLYDLRNLNAPVKTTTAHKTSVTCLRFQHCHTHHSKSSKGGVSSKSTVPSKRTSGKLTNLQWGPPAPTTMPSPKPVTKQSVDERGDSQNSGRDVFSRQTEEQRNADRLPSLDKFSNVGRNSLDIFSPVREDYKTHKGMGDPPSGQKADELDFLSRYSSSLPHRRTPLGTPAGHCYSPLSVFETPPPIREEETDSGHAVQDITPGEGKTSFPSLDLDPLPMAVSPQATPTPLGSQSNAAAASSCDTPLNGKLPTSAPAPAPSAGGVASCLSERIMETIGGEPGGAPLTSLQIHFIRNMIQETLEDFRDACHRDIVNLQVEMIRQFYIQLNEIHGLIEKYSVTDTLVEEIEKLKEENRRLRSNY
ncbi:protein NEDD1 isoform X1 [Conger conger]|uniref:protein NEDD1 isoform X1 n=2 Tax=Conger conger TaxID=82655 RepID=UPI002A59B8A9|nr:protein NEDD1 isoform X1 [Conger conger]